MTQQAKHTPQAEWLAGVLAKLPADDHARVLALILAQNRLNAELLAALKYAREILVSYNTTHVGTHHAAIGQADAAIAKAEGR